MLKLFSGNAFFSVRARGSGVLRKFLFFQVLSLFVDLQINAFRQSPSRSETESQSFRFSVHFLARSNLLFLQEPEPDISGPAIWVIKVDMVEEKSRGLRCEEFELSPALLIK
jgi:hypothetical protein